MMNELPEPLIILFSPIMALFAFFLLILYDHLYLIYLWFVKMGWFFKKNANSEESKKPLWENVSLFNPIEFLCAIVLVIIFFGLFFIMIYGLSILPFLTVFWCLFSSIFYKGQMFGKTISVLSVVGQMFKYYKFSFMTIISFFVIVTAFGTLGTIPGIFCIVVTVLMYFGVISIDLFQANKESGLTKLVSYNQAKKVCILPSSGKKNKHGIVYNLFNELFTGQTGGTILTKELRNLSKNYN